MSEASDHDDRQEAWYDGLLDEKLVDELVQQRSPLVNVSQIVDYDAIVVVHDAQQQRRYHDDEQINNVIDFIVRYDPTAYNVTHDNGGPRITYKRGGQLVVWPFLWDPNIPGRREQRIDIPGRTAGDPITP